MKLHITGMVIAGLFLGQAASAAAQSLADVARQEQERRKQIAEPARVYTDADAEKHLPVTTAAARPASGESAAPGADAAATPAGGHDAAAGGAASPSGTPAPATKKAEAEGEAAWRARVDEARDGLARSRRLLEALEQQAMRAAVGAAAAIAAGQAAAADADDGARMKEMQRLRAEMEKFSATLAGIEEEARRAGVPPGWVR
jgi:hypothetical protein